MPRQSTPAALRQVGSPAPRRNVPQVAATDTGRPGDQTRRWGRGWVGAVTGNRVDVAHLPRTSSRLGYGDHVLTPHQALTDLVHEDPTRPAITFYDDTPGPTQGERIEISWRVLDNWVAKAANALQEGLDVQRGSVVLLDLPCPHWRACYWALAVWSVGATLTLDAHEGADVLVTTDPDSPTAEDADEVVAVTLAGLAREFAGDLRSGVMDEAKEVSSFGDGFTAWDEPEADDDALVHDGERTAYQELFGEPTWPRGSRVLVGPTSPRALLGHLLQALATGSSLVLVRGSEPATDDPRVASEGVTLRA